MVNIKGWLMKMFGASTLQATATSSSEWLGEALGGGPSGTGMAVTPDTALKISTVWACVSLIADCVGMLPAIIYERMPDGNRKKAPNHPLFDVLHEQPNQSQTAFEFFQMMTAHMLMRGNAYAKIVPGPRGFADQLMPLLPDFVTPQLTQFGIARYNVIESSGARIYNDDEIFHLKGFTTDGFMGLSVVGYARESFGLALAGERSGAKTFANGSRPSGVLKTAGKLSEPAAKRVKASWQEAQAGVNNTGKVAVLEEGLEWQAMGLSNKDSQWLESREFQAEDICRWFRVPPHMVGLTSKATSWGSGIEQMGMGFVTYTLMPWLVRWQQAISRDLILAPDKYFVEWLTDALLKGDLTARYNAYAIARNWGWLSANDIRRKENQDPIDNGDIYLQPLNMIEAGTEQMKYPSAVETPPGKPLPNDPGEPKQPPASPANAHYAQLLHEAAGRIVRKEIAAITKLNAKYAEQSEPWRSAVNDFYSTHVAFVAQTLRIDLKKAQVYVNEQLGELARGVPFMADWESRRVADLVNMILEMK